MLEKTSLILVFLLGATPLTALDPHAKIADFVHTAWSGSEPPAHGVTNLAQTKDGTLWMAAGVVFRFDGVRFTRFNPLSRATVRNMIATQDGSLWVLFFSGRISRLSKGEVTTFPLEELPLTNAIAEDRDGSIVAATAKGLTRFRDGRWGTAARVPGFSFKYHTGVWFDRDGALWLATENRFLKRLPAEDHFTDPEIPVQPRFLPYLFQASPDGTAWFAGPTTTYSIKPDGRETGVQVRANMLMVERQGSVWIGDDEGIWRIPNPEAIAGKSIGPPGPEFQRFTKKEGLSGKRVWCAMEDREGNIWVGTDNGLDRFRDGSFHRVAFPDAERVDEMLALHDGGLLLRIRDRPYLQRVDPDGRITTLRFPGSKLEFQQLSIIVTCEDTDGTIWLGTSMGLGRVSGGRILYPPQPRLNSITRIGCAGGEVWIADAATGVFRFSAGKAATVPGLPGQVNQFFFESPGRVWLPSYGGSVYLYDNGAISKFAAKDGVPEGNPNWISKDLHGDIWLASQGGLARFRKGGFQNVDVMPGVWIWNAFSGDNPFIWVQGGTELARIDTREFDRAAATPGYRPQTERYGTLDGVPGPPMRTARSGRGLWFGTRDSLGYLDLDALVRKNPLPPPLQVETLTADDKTFNATQGITLPKLTHDLQIDYTAFSLTIPEKVQFRYKLEGVDDNWREAGTRRRAEYTNLGPKHYRFVVKACNNDGVWNEAGATLDFSIAPAYYQTHWFQAAYVAVFLSLLWGIYRYRLNQMARQFNVRFEERVLERTRIARELHDTLLQSFQGLALRLQVVEDLLPEGKAKEQLEQTLQRADQAIAEGRSAVYDLRSSATITNDLAQAVRALGDELATQDSAAFRLVVEGAVRDLHPIIRDELYRITREALRNAFSHARAHHIETEITYGEREFRLRIRDDGEGIPPEILEEGRLGHYGLPGMRERAKQIGGKLNIWSRAGAGTEIELSIAGSIAYRTPVANPFFRFLGRKQSDV